MRNVLVTGGSRGLGLGIARTLADSGYRAVALARRSTDQLTVAMRETADGSPGSLHFWPFDLAETDAIPGLVKSLRKEFGPIYGLVNNAADGASGVLATMADTEVERVVRLNTVSPMLLTKHVVRAMMVDGPGRIVSIASIVASTGFSGLTVYAATKASIVGFTRSLAREVGPLGITANCVAPGFVDTDMTAALHGEQRDKVKRRSPLQRMTEIADIAHAVEFLLGDKARNITGTVLTVDAGSTA